MKKLLAALLLAPALALATPVDHLEAVTGIDFHPNLPQELAHIEAETPDLARWPGITQ